MAQIKQGILGNFSGKVGSVVGSRWRGIAYMRGLAQGVKQSNSHTQMTVRQRFGVASRVASAMAFYLEVGYRNYGNHRTPVNAAVSHLIKDACVGEYPQVGIDQSEMIVSRGKLTLPADVAATVRSGEAKFTWTNDSGSKAALANDLAMPLVYNFTRRTCVYSIGMATRKDGSVTLAIPSTWANDRLSCYFAMASIENDDTSNSVYVGDVKADGTVVANANEVVYYQATGRKKTQPAAPADNSGSGSGTSGSGSTNDDGDELNG
jgi:hypothetical protein